MECITAKNEKRNNTQQTYSHTEKTERETEREHIALHSENENENGTFRRCDGFIYSPTFVKMFYNACMGFVCACVSRCVFFFILCCTFFVCAVCTFFSFSLIQVCRVRCYQQEPADTIMYIGPCICVCDCVYVCTWTDDDE